MKALRHDDAEGVLRPSHVDPASRHRVYAPEQVDVGRWVRTLRDLDLSLPLVRVLIADPGQRDLKARIVRDQRALHRLLHLREGTPMTTTPDGPDADLEAQARDWFNGTWDLMGKQGRTADDDDRMLHMAHASRFAWGEVGGPEQISIGEWQCSRVYTVEAVARAAMVAGDARTCSAALAEAEAAYVLIKDPADAALVRGDLDSITVPA